MSPELQIAVFNMIAKVGLESAVIIMQGMQNAATLDAAIKACQDAQKVGWSDAKVAPIK
jgi:hypothetical protein